VNVSGDGRLVVAAYGDGTIRWHKLDDGAELLAFLPLADRENWVAWTPEGFYAATPGAYGVLQWHVNHGRDEAPESVPVSDIPGSFRPAVLPYVLQELETTRALGLAEFAEHRRAVQIRTHSRVPPGAQLHVLAVGVSRYNEEHAKQLRLRYADKDAQDVASALLNTQAGQTGLYADVKVAALSDELATRAGILDALATMRDAMAKGQGRDLAVVEFSGHGAVVDGRLYLLPYDVDTRTAARVRSSALSADELRDELAELGKLGRVLVLLDACHSGAVADGAAPADAGLLRAALSASNVTVLTSSSGAEVSREDPAWGHGAFTQALLEALGSAADTNHDGLVSVDELMAYLTWRVPALTEGKQTPGIEARYEGGLFAAGL
jgi:Caspase domain